MDQRSIDPNEELSVRLKARDWEVVLAALRKAPYEVVAELIQTIVAQCMVATDEARTTIQQ